MKSNLSNEELASTILNCMTNKDQDTKDKCRLVLAKRFGEERGWKLSRRGFGLHALIKGLRTSWTHDWAKDSYRHEVFDHCYYYKFNGEAVAVVAHPYHYGKESLEHFCEKNGLTHETPNFPSWWFPNRTHIVVLKRKVIQ